MVGKRGILRDFINDGYKGVNKISEAKCFAKFKIDRARIRKFELKIPPQWKIVVLLLTVLVPLNLSVDDRCDGTRCDVNANCVFDEGRRQCVCKNGWTGDGTSCFGEYSC